MTNNKINRIHITRNCHIDDLELLHINLGEVKNIISWIMNIYTVS